MKSLTRFIAIASLLACPAVLAFPPHGQPVRSSAAGDSYWDFRFGWGVEPMLSEAEYETEIGDFAQDWEAGGASLEFNVAHRFAAPTASSGYITFGAFLRGFGGEDDPDSGAEIGLGAGGVQFGGGWSYRPSRRYSLEVGPRISLGTAWATEDNASGGEYESDTGSYARFDVGATNLFNFDRFQLGATLGLASWTATVPYERQYVYDSGVYELYPEGDATYSGSGAYLLFSLGFR
jgi:hypothetical protein